MADNYVTDEGSGGKTFRSLQDGDTVDWPTCTVAYATTIGSPDVLQEVTPEYPLPVGFNTAKDGSGTLYAPLVDSDGHVQVDVLSGGGGGTQYAEDAEHSSGATGTLALVVRADTAASLCGADGDYSGLIVDASGRLHCNVGNTVTVDCNGSNVTVDGVPAPLNVTGGGTEAAALRVTIANDSTGVVSIDDNGGSVTVDGTVTANAGTNLNTSALALESGGNLASAVTALQIIDDWDESDRAKVNLIVGQAGIAAGAGVVGVTVPRMTLASDDPAVALLTTIDADTGAIKTAVELIDHLTAAGAGAVDANTQRVTLGSDDPGVAHLATIAGDTTSLNGKVTACNTGAVVISSGTVTTVSSVTAIANALPAGDNNIGNVDIVTLPADTFAADAQAYGKGVLIQGDDGTDRRAVLVDTDGHVQIDVLSCPTITVDCNSSNVTVDGVPAPLNVTGGGTEAAALRVTLANDSTGVLSVDDNGGALTVDNAGTFAVQVDGDALTALQLIDDAVAADGQAYGKGVLVQGDDGTDRRAALVDTDGHFQIDVLSCASHAVTNAGTFAVQVDGNALTALQLIDDTVAVLGTATYSEGTTKGNVVGAVRNDDLATLANTDNEIAPLQVNSAGALFTEPAQQIDYVFDGSAKCTLKRASGLAASGTTAMVAAVASKKIRVFALFLLATSVTVTNVYIANDDNDILGDSSNPIPLSNDADGDTIPGFTLPWNPGGWFETDTANEALNLILSAAQDVIYALTYAEVA